MQSAGQTASNKQEVKLLGKDILPIHTTHEALTRRALLSGSGPVLLLALAPAACFFTVFFAKQSRDRSSGDPGSVRLKSAYKNFMKNFSEAQKALDGPEDRFYQAGSKALKDFHRRQAQYCRTGPDGQRTSTGF